MTMILFQDFRYMYDVLCTQCAEDDKHIFILKTPYPLRVSKCLQPFFEKRLAAFHGNFMILAATWAKWMAF